MHDSVITLSGASDVRPRRQISICTRIVSNLGVHHSPPQRRLDFVQSFHCSQKTTERERERETGSRTVVVCDPVRFLFLVFFFFFSGFFYDVLGSSLKFIRVINQVLETRFPCGHHVEKYATLDHGNRVFETLFIGQNQVFKT